MQYRCLPIGLCSWDFRIMRDQTIVACTRHDWMTEQGSIEIDTKTLAVVKHGVMSGEWSINVGGEAIATAIKPNPFTRRFELTASEKSYELAAVAMSRCFNLKQDGTTVASIAPDHPFTRRSSIQADDSMPIELTAFAFWLAVLCWQRDASSDA